MMEPKLNRMEHRTEFPVSLIQLTPIKLDKKKERKRVTEREIEADRDREKDEKKREMCALTHYAKRPLLNRKCCIFLCPLRGDSAYDETTNLHRNLSGTRDLN